MTSPRRFVQASYSLLDCTDPRVTSATIAVYVALRSFVNRRDHCWPSVPTIAQRAHVSTRTARSHLRLLEELGYVTVAESGGHGRRDTHTFKVLLQPEEW
jgi:Mn-dependent DtxR family transcriptional regulator